MQTKTQTSVQQAVAGVFGEPEFYVNKITPINSQFARIVGTVRASAQPQQLLNAVRKVAEKCAPVKGSFVAVASNGLTTTYEGIIGTINERIVLTEQNQHKFRSIASNMYMDEEDKLWSMKKTEAGNILISSHASDELEVMQNLMKSVASSAPEQAVQQRMSETDASRARIRGGDLALFVSESGALSMGFVAAAMETNEREDAGVAVVTQLDEDVQVIDRNMVIAYVSGDEIDADETAELEAVASGNINMDVIADYYRRVFQRRPEYFEMFMERFRNHVFA